MFYGNKKIVPYKSYSVSTKINETGVVSMLGFMSVS